MIVKSFEFQKILQQKLNNYLFYGDNNGFKNEIIQENFKLRFKKNIFYYEESEILKDKENFFEKILTQSFFDNEKLIIISRSTDKITTIAEEIVERKIQDLVVIFISEKLEKKSKLRNLFEKNKELVIVPTYKDTSVGLLEIARKFFYNYKISISQEAINLLVSRCNGDRGHLKSELDKVLIYMHGKKNINLEEIYKLTNLSENFSINELADTTLSKNSQKTSEIINESNYKSEDGILILRTFLQKAKRLLNLYEKKDENTSLDSLIDNYKPPIFWKDKPIVKRQLESWSKLKIENLIININKTEAFLKKNSSISLMLVFNFIYETSEKNQ